MKRFYKIVTTQNIDGGYRILLDGKPVKTPQKNILATAHKELAEAIVLEWAAQKENILPDTMPLTQILTTKIDRVATQRDEMTGFLLKYIDTDLVCYRAAEPPEMVGAQAKHWDPVIRWFEQNHKVTLQTTNTLQVVKQPAQAHEIIAKFITNLNDDEFTIMQIAAATSGSVMMGMMFMQNAIDADDIFAAARAEEAYHAQIYNEEKYGPEPQQEKKDAAIKRDLEAAQNYLNLIR